MLRKLKLSVAFAVVQLTAATGLQEAQAEDASTQKTTVNIGTTGGQPLSQICTFTTNASYYYSVGKVFRKAANPVAQIYRRNDIIQLGCRSR